MRTWKAAIVQERHYQKNRKAHRVEKRQVDPTNKLRLKLTPGGGSCVIFEESSTH